MVLAWNWYRNLTGQVLSVLLLVLMNKEYVIHKKGPKLTPILDSSSKPTTMSNVYIKDWGYSSG